MNDLISVVVPIYNVEKYLKKCIDSILIQTYENIEIILVDDGSLDNCGKICDEYEKDDKRVKVIHKQNGGLSDARNAGINIAKGKYITFIDSDDFVERNSIELLYRNIIEYGKDISIGQIYRFHTEKNMNKKETKEHIKVYETKEAMEQLLYNNQYSTSTAGKLFLTNLFENIKFPYGKKYEDLATVYKLIFNSNGVVVTNQNVYNYFVARPDSIMNEKFTPTRMDALYFTEEILKFIKIEFPDLESAAITRLIIECRDIFVEIPEKEEYEKYEDCLYEYIKKYKFKVLLNRKLPFKRRISLLPILFGKKSIKLAWNLKLKIKELK